MSKFIILGDPHVFGATPRHRKDDYYETALKKLGYVGVLAKDLGANIIIPGDLFHSPNTSLGVISTIAQIIRKWDLAVYGVIGNHDMFGGNLEGIYRTPYGLLAVLQYITDLSFYPYVGKDVILYGVPYSLAVDKDYSEYAIKLCNDSRTNILVCHTMIMPEAPKFEMRYSLIDGVAKVTEADIIISGHLHTPFIERRGRKLFINPGSMMRIAASEAEIARMPHVVLLDTALYQADPLGYIPEIVPIEALPGEEVLSREFIELANQREGAMAEFIASLQYVGEEKFLQIAEIIEALAADLSFDSVVANEALKRIAQAREAKKY